MRQADLGTVPAVQTKVRDGIEVSSVKTISPSVMLLTRVLCRISTRFKPALSRDRPEAFTEFGKITGPECTSTTRNIFSHSLG